MFPEKLFQFQVSKRDAAEGGWQHTPAAGGNFLGLGVLRTSRINSRFELISNVVYFFRGSNVTKKKLFFHGHRFQRREKKLFFRGRRFQRHEKNREILCIFVTGCRISPNCGSNVTKKNFFSRPSVPTSRKNFFSRPSVPTSRKKNFVTLGMSPNQLFVGSWSYLSTKLTKCPVTSELILCPLNQ